MLSSPTAMGITGFTGLPSATHFSISPATCQGQAAVAVAAFAGILRRRPQAPGIICATQFARLQIILNTALESRGDEILSSVIISPDVIRYLKGNASAPKIYRMMPISSP